MGQLQNKDVVLADKSIKMDPAKSVLGFRAGDDIGLTEAEFLRLFEAFFSEIEAKYL